MPIERRDPVFLNLSRVWFLDAANSETSRAPSSNQTVISQPNCSKEQLVTLSVVGSWLRTTTRHLIFEPFCGVACWRSAAPTTSSFIEQSLGHPQTPRSSTALGCLIQFNTVQSSFDESPPHRNNSTPCKDSLFLVASCEYGTPTTSTTTTVGNQPARA